MRKNAGVQEAAPARQLPPEHDPDSIHLPRAGEWIARRGPLDDRLVMAGGGLLAVAVALWMTAGAWGPRPISGEDSLPHLVRAEFAVRTLFASGRLDGWHPGFITGYQEFLFIGPGFTLAVALVHWLSLGVVSVAGAFKAVVIASFAAVPLSVAFLARSAGLGRRAAGVAAVLSLAVNNPFGGVGLQGLFNVGLVSHQFAAPFFFLGFGGTLRLLRRPGPDRPATVTTWTALTAVSLALVLVTHSISAVILGGLLLVTLTVLLVPRWRPRRHTDVTVLVRREVRAQLRLLGLLDDEPDHEAATAPTEPPPATDRPTREGLRRVALAYLLAAALAACALLPSLGSRDLRGIITAWGTPPLGQRVADIWRGQILFRPGVALLVAVGLGYGVARVVRGRPYAVLVVATPVVVLCAGHIALRLWPGSVLTPQLTNRALGYVGVLAVLPLAALVAHLGRRAGPLGDAAALALAVAIVVVPLGDTRQLARQNPVPIAQMGEAARQLAGVVPEGARFVTQRDYPAEIDRTKVVHPDLWLAWASGRNTLNAFNVESSSTPQPAYESEHIVDRSPEAVADALARLGTTHVVTVSDAAAERLGSSPRFVPVWRGSPLAIFGVVATPGQPEPAALVTADAPLRARALRTEPERLVLEVDAVQATTATVAIGHSPKWHARLDGRPVPVQKSADGLLQIPVSAGTGRLTLEFRRDLWDHAGQAVTVVTAMVGGGVLIRRRRAARA